MSKMFVIRIKTDKSTFEEWLEEHDKEVRNKAIDDVKNLISERLKRECDFNSCDDCEECCEIEALLHIEEQLNQTTDF